MSLSNIAIGLSHSFTKELGLWFTCFRTLEKKNYSAIKKELRSNMKRNGAAANKKADYGDDNNDNQQKKKSRVSQNENNNVVTSELKIKGEEEGTAIIKSEIMTTAVVDEAKEGGEEMIEEMEVEEEEDEGFANSAAVNFVVKKEERKKCPYLDTINRQLLDFDMEKVCSVTLSNLNVYCCLICGKYFQGRGKSTPAYTHSVAAGKNCDLEYYLPFVIDLMLFLCRCSCNCDYCIFNKSIA